MLRFTYVLLVLTVGIAVMGCQQELEIVLNEDGSGTLRGIRILEDRVRVAAEMAKSEMGSGMMFMPTELLEGPIDNALLRAEAFDTFEMVNHPDGAVTAQFEKAFPDIDTLLALLEENFDSLKLFKNADGEGVFVMDISSDTGPGAEDSGAEGLNALYIIAKGLHSGVDFTAPAELTVNAGQTEGGRVRWELDLRSHVGLERSRELVSGLEKPVLKATFPLEGLGFDLPEKTLQTALGDKTESPAPDVTMPTADEIKAGVSEITVSKTQETPGGPLTSAEVFIRYAMQMPEGTRPMHLAEPASIEVVTNGETNETTPTQWNAFEMMDDWECHLRFDLPDPAAGVVDMMRTEAFMTLAAEVTELEFTLKELKAMAGKQETGNETLDAAGITVEMGEGSVKFRHTSVEAMNEAQMEQREIVSPIVKAEIEQSGGFGTMTTSGQDWNGACSLNFRGGDNAAPTIRLTVARSTDVMAIPLSLENYTIP